MEMDHLRSSNVSTYCKTSGHSIQDCRRRQREINIYTVAERNIANQTGYDKNRRDKTDCWNCGKFEHFSRECKTNKQCKNTKKNPNQKDVFDRGGNKVPTYNFALCRSPYSCIITT